MPPLSRNSRSHTVNRKERRAAQKLARKSGNKDLEEKLSLIESMDDKCRACHKDFDKTDATVISEWMIVVRRDKKESHVYCPECWEMAKQMISEADSDASSKVSG